MPLRERLRYERQDRLADLRNLDLKLTLRGLHVPRSKPVAQTALALRPTLIASTAEPLIELLLDSPLDDQPGAEPRELGQHLLWIIDQLVRQQLVDARLYLRRRRDRASHGVGLLQSSCR